MDKYSLPKLETGGFSNSRKIEPVVERSWKDTAAGYMRKAGIQIRNPRMRRQPGTASKKEDTDLGYRRLLIKTGVCAAIAVVILGIASINTPEAEALTETISEAVNHEFDIDEDIGRLKFVDNLNDNLQSVFSPLPEAAVVFPAPDGKVLTTFGQAGSKGVRISPAGTEIVCIARGTVEYIGEIDGRGYIKVNLDTGEDTYFYNITPSVSVDDIVMPGQAIGNLEGDYLYLEMKSGEDYIDPIEFIQQRAALAVG